jgi:hypothetical protein
LKAPKKAPKGELDEEDKAFQEKQKAGMYQESMHLRLMLIIPTDAKAKAELAAKASGKKGPLNTGSQGIKKSGKK